MKIGAEIFHYFGARYYDSDVSIWLSVDPLASKYPSLSPYVYCANNPITRINPNGMGDDWYENKEGKAVYSETIRSQKDLNDAGIDGKYIGITGYTSDKSQYLSLFGEKVNTKTADGKINLTAKMVENLDNAIINLYKATYFNDWKNRDPFVSESFAGETDMFVRNVTPQEVANNQHIKRFNYAGGKVHYQMSDKAKGGVFTWGKGKVEKVGGYHTTLGTGVNAIVSRNDATLRIVNWIFPTTNDWQKTKSRADGLLNNRKW